MRNKATNSGILALVLLLLHLLDSKEVFALRNATVATIGASVPSMDKIHDKQQMVERVLFFWEKELKQVLPHKPDLIVLPEACDRPNGLSTEAQFEYFRIRKDQVQNYFMSVAKENHCYIAFGTKRQTEDGTWRNSTILLDRNGEVSFIYNKNYPTIGEMESGIVAGIDAPVFQCDFGSVACAICFDLNFTELRDRYAAQKPDIILFPSMYHGGMMQADWAYTCRSFFVGAIGNAKVPSQIRDPQGDVLASSTNYFDFAVATINLDTRIAHLDFNWEKLTKLKQKYGPGVTIKDPGKLGSVIVSSELQHIGVDEMIKEFEIELLDDYLNRSKKFREGKTE
jgi:hypothetical protein